MKGGSTLTWKDVVAAVESLGEATPREIVLEMEKRGGDPSPVLVRQMIKRLVERAILKRVSHGRYALRNGYQKRIEPVRDKFERLIAEALVACGGIARTKEIHEAVWGKPKGGLDRGYEYRCVTETLKQSGQFQQGCGRGIWHLPVSELLRLPLIGRWATLDIEGQLTGPGPDVLDRDDFFQRVGQAFAEARSDISAEIVVSHPAVKAALCDMELRAPAARETAVRYCYDDLKANNDVTPDPQVANHQYNLYLMFESGNVELHIAATAQFYQACADLFGVDAAALSRGGVKRLNLDCPQRET